MITFISRTATTVPPPLCRWAWNCASKTPPSPPADAEFNFFLAVLFPPASDLKIWPYNRLVADLAGISQEEFLKRVGEHFTVEPAPTSPFEPQTKHTFGMYLHGRWYKLTAKSEIIHDSDPVRGLDAAILQENLLSPPFCILRTRAQMPGLILWAELGGVWVNWSGASG